MHQLTELLFDFGEISLAEGAVFIDGIKIEANTNRYSFVWKSAINHRCKGLWKNRIERLDVSKYFAKQREAMEKKISTEEGILLRVNRSIQAEGVFAYTKEDLDFRKFLLRGTENISAECFLMAIAHNILKLHHKIQKDRLGSHLIVSKVS